MVEKKFYTKRDLATNYCLTISSANNQFSQWNKIGNLQKKLFLMVTIIEKVKNKKMVLIIYVQ